MEKHKFSDTKPRKGQWIWVQREGLPVKVSILRNTAFWRDYHTYVSLRDDDVWSPCVSPFSVDGMAEEATAAIRRAERWAGTDQSGEGG